jgi:hypothetical protein
VVSAVTQLPIRFSHVFRQKALNALNGLRRRALYGLPSLKEGHTLDLDSWALLHEDGHQQGVAVGYPRQELKPCHRPLIAALAQTKLVANYWLRSGDSACANGAAEFLRLTVQAMPVHIRLGLVRGDHRHWWREILAKLTASPNCHAVASLQA